MTVAKQRIMGRKKCRNIEMSELRSIGKYFSKRLYWNKELSE